MANMTLAKHIKWQDVIEVEEKSDPTSRKKVIKALAFLESSKEGQKLFVELQESQSHIPDGQVWQKKLREPATEGERIEATRDNDRLLSRKDNKKTLLIVNYNKELKKQDLDIFTLVFEKQFRDANYDEKLHTLNLSFPEVEMQKDAKSIKGKKDFTVSPLYETIAHELQHTIDETNARFLTKKRLTSECREERAVERENKFAPNERYTYYDVELLLEKVHNDPRFKAKFPSNQFGETELLWGIERMIEINSGCQGMSNEAILEKAIQLMKKHDIPTDKISPEFLPKNGTPKANLGALSSPNFQVVLAKPENNSPTI